MTITALEPATGRRAAVLQGLANLWAFIETHPDLPLAGPHFESPFSVLVHGRTDQENLEEVDRIAAILGVAAVRAHTGCRRYAAVRDFGGGICYRVFAMAPERIGPRDLLPAAVTDTIARQPAGTIPGGAAA